MTNWQPIDTAPKPPKGSPEYRSPENDQKYWLLGWDGEHLAIIAWYDKWYNEYDTSDWIVIHDGEQYAWREYTPTHWMPLPSPPNGEINNEDPAKGLLKEIFDMCDCWSASRVRAKIAKYLQEEGK
jgi:hypothetical protein